MNKKTQSTVTPSSFLYFFIYSVEKKKKKKRERIISCVVKDRHLSRGLTSTKGKELKEALNILNYHNKRIHYENTYTEMERYNTKCNVLYSEHDFLSNR